VSINRRHGGTAARRHGGTAARRHGGTAAEVSRAQRQLARTRRDGFGTSVKLTKRLP
jgi:hypothetical protein